MARKITDIAIDAFYANRSFRQSNTEVSVRNGVTRLILHDNIIAKKENGVLSISNAGWESNVTKERLNALSGVRIQQKKGVWYLNGEQWDGSWKVINR